MRALAIQLILVIFFCCYAQDACCQVRIRRGIRLPKFRNKEKVHQPKKQASKKRNIDLELHSIPPGNKDNAIDEHFYVKWNNTCKLAYNDFKYNKNLYDKFVPDKDTDLINTIYPDYIAFYNSLRKRKEQDQAYMVDDAHDERIERMLRLKVDSIEQGFISSATLNIDLSFTLTVDSPAASVLALTPVIYALNESTYYFNITPLFNKYDSWMIVKSADILQHEQIHFDIFELFARKMRKHLVETLQKDYSNSTTYDMSLEITPVYELLYQQLNQMQVDFDKQTGEKTAVNQSLNNINALWNEQLRVQLDALRKYELPEGTIMLK